MQKYLPTLLLLSFLSRLLVTGASIGDAFVIIGLSALYASSLYFENQKDKVPNEQLLEKITSLEEQFKASKDKLNALSLSTGLKR